MHRGKAGRSEKFYNTFIFTKAFVVLSYVLTLRPARHKIIKCKENSTFSGKKVLWKKPNCRNMK